MPITTPASTPAESTPTTAAAAIQKSKRLTRYRRRSSGTSIIPKTTASMMIAASTAFGSWEKSGASATRVRITNPPVASEAIGAARPRRLVERARRQARRDRHPLEDAGGRVRHPLRDRLLVDVDAVAVADGERARVAGRLREADQEQARGGGEDGRVVLAGRRRRPAASARAGRAARARRARRRARRGRTARWRAGPRRRARARRARAERRSAGRG